jgi:flagellar motor switch protein FliN
MARLKMMSWSTDAARRQIPAAVRFPQRFHPQPEPELPALPVEEKITLSAPDLAMLLTEARAEAHAAAMSMKHDEQNARLQQVTENLTNALANLVSLAGHLETSAYSDGFRESALRLVTATRPADCRRTGRPVCTKPGIQPEQPPDREGWTMTQPANPALQKSLMDVPVRVDVVLGEVRMPMEELVAMSADDVVALERRTDEPVEIYVSDRLMARGRLVVADGQLGVTLSEIVDSREAA